MGKAIAMLLGTIMLAGCASTANDEAMSALDSRLAAVENSVSQALELAREAKNDAARAASANAENGRLAQQALTAAQAASEQARRISDECCARK